MTPIHLWSAGNLRLATLDLTIPARDAQDLVHAMKGDQRVRPILSRPLSMPSIISADVSIVRDLVYQVL
jgi:hypothetical protein